MLEDIEKENELDRLTRIVEEMAKEPLIVDTLIEINGDLDGGVCAIYFHSRRKIPKKDSTLDIDIEPVAVFKFDATPEVIKIFREWQNRIKLMGKLDDK